MTSHVTPLSTILDRVTLPADAIGMSSDRIHSFYTTAIVGCGMVFILGAFLAADAAGTRALFAGIFLALLTGGIFVLMLLRRTNVLEAANDRLQQLNSEATSREDDLRTQLHYTLREPLAQAAGKADRLMSSPSMPYDQQQAILTSIRDNAREVEQALETLAAHGSLRTLNTPRLSSVVLLDEELRSIGETSSDSDRYDFDIEQARAWGDPALVRQILRTLVNVSTQDQGGQLTLQTAQRGPVATATVSGKGAILPMAARAALSEVEVPSGSDDGSVAAVKAAVSLAATMGGSISYVQAFGISHVLLTLPTPDSQVNLGAQPPATQTEVDQTATRADLTLSPSYSTPQTTH